VIDGVKIIPLKQIKDERGMVMHMLRADAAHFKGFGEIYFSVVNLGTIKAWKRHKKMTQSFAVPQGSIKLVIFDDRNDSPTKGQLQEIVIGIDAYQLVQIPPMLWYGFTAQGDVPALIANCADMMHDPGESEAVAPAESSIPYQW